MTGTVLRRLGWEPKFGVEAWDRDFENEFVAIEEGRRGGGGILLIAVLGGVRGVVIRGFELGGWD